MLGEEVARPGDWSVRGPNSRPAAGRSSSHNDNYPDIDDTAEVVLALRRVRHHDPARVDAAIGRGGALGARDAVAGRRLGRVRRRQHQRARPQAAVLRLRRGDRPAVRGRHRARGGDARPLEGLAGDARARARHRLAARAAGAGRLVVRALGRELRLRHRRGVPGLVAGGLSPAHAGDPARGALAGGATRTRTAAGARTCAPTTTRAWVGRGDITASQTAWALLALLAAGERSTALARGVRVARRRPSARTAPGTSRSSPAPASRGTSPSTTTCTGRCSRVMALGRCLGAASRP